MNTFKGTVVWADLEKPSKFGKFGVTLTVDRNSESWQAFEAFISELCSESDVCRSADELTRNLGDNSAEYLNNDLQEPVWHSSDQCVVFRTKEIRYGVDLTVRRGDVVEIGYGASVYSFENDEGEQIEGVALYLNNLRRFE